MALNEALLSEFDQEMAGTRKTLERVPEDKFSWKPHEKSMSLCGLTTHLTNMASWASTTLETDSFDYMPNGEIYREPEVASVAAALEAFDKGVAAARAALAGASDEQLLKPWSLLANGSVIFTMPRIAVWRTSIMNHLVHHRGQLTVYLRLNDVPVPGLFGPSADEQGNM